MLVAIMKGGIIFSVLVTLLMIQGRSAKITDGDLSGTKWVHNLLPQCTDSLVFISFNKGREYRCEFEEAIKFTYTYKNGTLILSEWRLKSEVNPSLGSEIKFKWRYIHKANQLTLTGYASGPSRTIESSKDTVIYTLAGR